MDERRLMKLSDAQVVNDYFKVNVIKGSSHYSDDQKKLVKDCLEQSSETSKTILKMHYWESITLAEIAKILGLALETVKKLHEKAVHEVRIRYFSQNILYKKDNAPIDKIMNMAQAV
jgi:DNA-directed RNA polymerase specialized sigma24 family protein